MHILIQYFSLLLIGLDKYTGIAYEVRISFGKNEPHSFWVDKRHKPKHSLLLVRNPYILHRSKLASKYQKRLLNSNYTVL